MNNEFNPRDTDNENAHSFLQKRDLLKEEEKRQQKQRDEMREIFLKKVTPEMIDAYDLYIRVDGSEAALGVRDTYKRSKKIRGLQWMVQHIRFSSAKNVIIDNKYEILGMPPVETKYDMGKPGARFVDDTQFFLSKTGKVEADWKTRFTDDPREEEYVFNEETMKKFNDVSVFGSQKRLTAGTEKFWKDLIEDIPAGGVGQKSMMLARLFGINNAKIYTSTYHLDDGGRVSFYKFFPKHTSNHLKNEPVDQDPIGSPRRGSVCVIRKLQND